MRTIYKYPLAVTDVQDVEVPEGSKILTVQVQHGIPCIWVNVSLITKTTVKRRIKSVGTGHLVPELNHNYLGTYQLEAQSLVFHVFEDMSNGE